MNTNIISKWWIDGVNVAIEKYKGHAVIKFIDKTVLFESSFSFKEIPESDIQKEISNLNSQKAGTFGNIPTKVLKDSSNVGHSILRDIWKYEIFRKQYFLRNLKLTDITPLYKKKDPTLIENYWPVSELPCVSKVFERIIQKQISSSTDKFIFPYFCGCRNGFNT